MFRAPNKEEGEEQEDYAHLRVWRRAVILRTGRFLSRAILFVFGFYWISETRGQNEVSLVIIVIFWQLNCAVSLPDVSIKDERNM